jgi:hypothetical protein
MSPAIRLVEVGEPAALESLRPAWSRLVARLDDDSPYLTPEFLLPWIRLTRDRYRCRVLTAWEGDELLGLAPIFERSLARAGVAFTVRSFPTFGATPPFDVLIADREQAVMTAFVGHWLSGDRWDLIELATVPSESRTAALLREATRDRAVELSVERSHRTLVVPVATTWEVFLASRSRNFRRSLRRGERKGDDAGGVQLLRYPGEGLGVDQCIAMAVDVIARSWKAAADDRVRWEQFFRDLMRELAACRRLSVRFLVVDGAPIAYLLEIAYREALYAFHTAMDLAGPDVNAGLLLLSDAVRDAHQRPYRRVELGGVGEYLERWTDWTRSFDRIRLVNPSIASRLKTRLFEWERTRRRLRDEREAEGVKRARKTAARRAGEGPPGPMPTRSP